MSYCRFSGADAYIYLGYRGLECCGCILAPKTKLETPYVDSLGLTHEYDTEPIGPFTTASAMLEHINEHRAHGHDIPLDVDERIKEDFPDLFASTVETEEERLLREKETAEARKRIRAKMLEAYKAEKENPNS